MKGIWLMSAALVACASNEAEPMHTTVTSAGMNVDVNPAIERITDDRCNRQLSCGNIGRNMTWRDRTDCEGHVGKQTRSLLGPTCRVVDAARLQTCINEIRDQRCEQTGSVPVSCDAERLCR